MPFDVAKFEKAKFEPRKAGVSVSGSPLIHFFAAGDEQQFVVRGLTGIENAIVNEANLRSENISAVVTALVSAVNADAKAKEIKKAIGFSDDTPADVARRTELIRLGSVDPIVDYGAIAKIAEVSPIMFYNISNKVIELTGLGQEYIAKRAPSTNKAKSGLR